MGEPRTDSVPLRIGLNGDTAKYSSLGEIRNRMDSLTRALIEIAAERYKLTQQAVYFKDTRDEVEAPEQQRRNLKAALEHAEQVMPGDQGFAFVVEGMMRATIETSVTQQLRAFEDTRPIGAD